MAQYKAAMERIRHEDVEKSISIDNSTEERDGLTTRPQEIGNDNDVDSTVLCWLTKYSGFIMMPVLPLLWCILLVTTLDREMVSSAIAMPLLGICSASLANAVPVGGGIVFVPVLALFNVQLKLGAAFAVATMTFGNGVFGFLSWLRKDPDCIAWSVVPYAVFPAWIGAALGTFYPFLTPMQCRHLFSAFCILVAIVVGCGIYKNRGVNKPFSIVNDGEETEMVGGKIRRIFLASSLSFLSGLVLVSHIGIGNAMMTFLVCTFVWCLPAKSAVVTGILVGGWTSVMPFVIHLFFIGDVPIALWVMGLPGVYIGARIAPHVHERLGITNVLIAFVIFLLLTAALMIFA